MKIAAQTNETSQHSQAHQFPNPSQTVLDRIIMGKPAATGMPKPVSALDMDPGTKATVLLALLQQNREEIRFWHEKMFQASFALDSAMMVVAAFVLHEPGKNLLSLWLAIFACLLFVVFHLIVGRLGGGAIRINGRDLEFIQAGLHLSEPGIYLKKRPIYKWTGTEWIPQRHFVSLHILNWCLALGLMVILLYRIAAHIGQ